MVEVIFLKKVVGIAEAGQVKKVADGYAINYLIPQGLAELATADKKQWWQKQQERHEYLVRHKKQTYERWHHQLNNRLLTFRGDVSPAGTLYASLKTEQIAQMVAEQLKVLVTSEQIIINEPIKTLGDHIINVRLGTLQAKLIIKVEKKKHGQD